ncbi:MAG: hypothetical protein ACRDRO_08380 [Pseudonocardiaceae bacterium]
MAAAISLAGPRGCAGPIRHLRGARHGHALVLLYAQPVARISRLRTEHVTIHDTTVARRLGSTPITLPDPVAELTQQLLGGKRGHATTGAGRPLPRLFPADNPAARSAPPT